MQCLIMTTKKKTTNQTHTDNTEISTVYLERMNRGISKLSTDIEMVRDHVVSIQCTLVDEDELLGDELYQTLWNKNHLTILALETIQDKLKSWEIQKDPD